MAYSSIPRVPQEVAYLSDDPRLARLIEFGRQFHLRGWVPATGGNFSVRRRSDRVLITPSGVHKGELRCRDFIEVDLDGRVCAGIGNSSYETALHLMLYRRDGTVGCVLHTHSVATTVLSLRHSTIRLSGYELMKVFPGISDPAHCLPLPVFANDQQIQRLAERVGEQLSDRDTGAFLLAGHGLYAWGVDPAQARDRVEALESMLESQLWMERS